MEAGEPTIDRDHPISDQAHDRLGFAQTAKRLAAVIGEQSSEAGVVIGLEGKWGSGKSSLLKLVLDELRTAAPELLLVEFRPWLVGNRDTLLPALFGELAAALDKAATKAGKPRGEAASALKGAAEKVRNFGGSLGALGKLISTAGLFVPGLGLVGEAVSGVADAAKDRAEGPSISALKLELEVALRAAKAKILVVVDDVDRLSPSESIEILRLIKSVADFENVTYLLCYDHDVISNALRSSEWPDGGDLFLEKIIQVVFPVPIPESFELRRWFSQELAVLSQNLSEDTRRHLETTVDREGGRRLKTPRGVVRSINAVRSLWPVLQDEVDLGDLVWLQLVRCENPALYRWIEEYCFSAAAVMTGRATVSDENAKQSLAELETHLKRDKTDFQTERYYLSEYLPGIDGIGDRNIFGRVQASKIQEAIDTKRLASPDHYRLYFALTAPSHAPKHSDYELFWDATDDSAAAVESMLRAFLVQKQPSGATKAEIIMDRISSGNSDYLTQKRAKNILGGLSNMMDDAAILGGTSEWGRPVLWREGGLFVEAILKKYGAEKTNLLGAYRLGSALEWLTDMLRDEIFAHGRVGNERRGDATVTAEVLDNICQTMISRYNKLSLKQISSLRRPVSLLFGWAQAGDEIGPKRLIESEIETDEGLLRALETLKGHVTTSGEGRIITLTRQNVGYFMDYDKARARIAAMTKGRASTKRIRAQEIESYFAAGARF